MAIQCRQLFTRRCYGLIFKIRNMYAEFEKFIADILTIINPLKKENKYTAIFGDFNIDL